MSTISNRHTIKEYISGISKPLDGQILARAIFKGRGNKPAPHKSQCASIPAITASEVQENLAAVMPHILTMLQGAQNECLRSVFLAGEKEITSEECGMQAAVNYLDAEAKGTRLTGEDVKAWFAGEVEEHLTVVFADKLGIGEEPTEAQSKRLQQYVNSFREGFATLASGKTRFSPKNAEIYRNLLIGAGADDSLIGARFAQRLHEMQNASEDDMMQALGF